MIFDLNAITGPHRGQPVLVAGAPVDVAGGAVIAMHGRGASASDILSLAAQLRAADFAFIAPEAAGSTWYPYSFLAPIAQNEPGLSSGLDVIGTLLRQLGDVGMPPERTILLGFSQGACLTLEFAARNAGPYGGVAGLSGGLIGPPGTARDYAGAFAATPIFLGCSDVDFHIPKERVIESAEVLERMGAAVTMRLYRGMGHTVNGDEISAVRQMLLSISPGET